VLLAGSASVVVSLFADCIILLNECIESNHLFRNVLARPVLFLVLRRRFEAVEQAVDRVGGGREHLFFEKFVFANTHEFRKVLLTIRQ